MPSKKRQLSRTTPMYEDPARILAMVRIAHAFMEMVRDESGAGPGRLAGLVGKLFGGEPEAAPLPAPPAHIAEPPGELARPGGGNVEPSEPDIIPQADVFDALWAQWAEDEELTPDAGGIWGDTPPEPDGYDREGNGPEPDNGPDMG